MVRSNKRAEEGTEREKKGQGTDKKQQVGKCDESQGQGNEREELAGIIQATTGGKK